MDFIVKDLMITLLPIRPGTERLAACDAGCSNPKSLVDWSINGQGCPLPHLVSDPVNIANLKHQLTLALVALEAREKVVLESLRPKSEEELEFLHKRLAGALEQVKQQMASLKENPD